MDMMDAMPEIPTPITPSVGNQNDEARKKLDELISDEEALTLLNKTYADYDHGRKPFERQWYRNILFLLGNQWIIWDTLENKWRKKRLADWVPTPVTNKFASSGQRLVSVLARIEPNWTYTPATGSAEDISAAEMCEQAEDVICEENKIENIRQSVAPWTVYTGNCFLLSGVEPILGPAPEPVFPPATPTGTAEQPMPPDPYGMMANTGLPEGTLQPSGANQSDLAAGDANMGNAPTTPDFASWMAEMGAAAPEPLPQVPVDYTLFTDVLAPFEVYLDQTIENFDNQVKIMVVNRRSKEYVKNLWGEDIDDLDVAPNIHYQESIGYITSSPEITGFLASLSRIKRVTVKRLFCKPTDKYPGGLYVVAAGSKILEKQELPKDSVGNPFVPVSQIKFDNIPGAAFGRTPMDDIVHKQIQRNKIESLMELIILRMGSPIWLMPEGTVLRNFTGAPGAIINYSLVGDKATKPDRIPGEQVPTSVVQFLANIDKDIEDLVSTFEALKGQSPYSGAPGVVIEQLIEQGLTRFGPSLRNVAEGYRLWMKHQLEFFRTYGIAEKTVMKKDEGQSWTSQTFKGSDIVGAVNVRVESDSTVPRSSQVEVAKILEAMNVGLVNIGDPNVRLKVLQKLHISDLNDDVAKDQIAAVRENDLFKQGQMPQVSPFLDNHDVHIYEHRQFANSEEGAPYKQQAMQHLAQHNMIKDAEQNPGVPMTGGPGGPPPTGGPPSPTGKVSPGAEKALNPGAPPPGQVPPGIQ